MFRARFAETLPKSLANFGPQELERDIVDSVPGERVEHFLCALLGLLLNRKQDVKYVANPSLHHIVMHRVSPADSILQTGPGITIVHSRKLSRRIKPSGRGTGRARILWPVELPSPL